MGYPPQGSGFTTADLVAAIAAHAEDADAHHEQYTDEEAAAIAAAIVGVHADVGSAHHTKFTTTEHDVVARHPLANLAAAVCSETEAQAYVTAHSTAPALAHLLAMLTLRSKVLYIPALLATDLAAGGGFTEGLAGTGGATSLARSALQVTVNSDIGSARLYRLLEYNLSTVVGGDLDWSKEFYFQFSLTRTTPGAGSNPIEGYVQIKTGTSAGALSGQGIGVRILGTDGLSIQGEAYGSEVGSAAFAAALSSNTAITIGIHHRPGVSVDFYRDGVKEANSITVAEQIPSTNATAAQYLMVSLTTTDDPNANIKLEVGSILIVQAY